SFKQAQRFLEITQQQENAGQVAHSDVVKAQVQYEQQRQGLQEAMLGMENTRLNLAVLLFPELNENFTVVDDLDSARTLPPFSEVQTMAGNQNPDIRVAQEALRQATQDVRIAQNALLPSLAIDGNYGIEANAFALHSVVAAAPQYGPLPNHIAEPPRRHCARQRHWPRFRSSRRWRATEAEHSVQYERLESLGEALLGPLLYPDFDCRPLFELPKTGAASVPNRGRRPP